MEEIKITSLSEEEIQNYDQLAHELAEKYNVSKVHPVVMVDTETNERIVCFLKEPNYLSKLRIMDKASQLGAFSAGDELRELITLKDESDPRTYGSGTECDKYKLGVTNYCIAMIELSMNQFKKNRPV